MQIAVIGACGKLGSTIVSVLEKLHNVIPVDKSLNNSLSDIVFADCVIDASAPHVSVYCAQYCSENNIPLLIACTGHTSDQINQIDQLCSNIAYAMCPNLSAGILWIMQSLTHVNLLTNAFISITETHHKSKKDCPSGTAIALKNQIEKYSNSNAYITSIRDEDSVGTHTINITLDGEEISITHKAFSRKVFANGALRAIEMLCTLPSGKYSLINLLGASYEN